MTKINLTPDARHSGGRYNRTYVRATNGSLIRFTGNSIPGVCVVLSATHTKNGQWSSSTYTVELGEGVRAFDLIQPLHQKGVFTGCGTWAEAYALVSAAAGGPVSNFESWLRSEYSGAATRLDEVAAALEAVAETEAQIEPSLLNICVGPFPKRERHLAKAEIALRSPSGETATITRGEHNIPWLTSAWAEIVDRQCLPGHGGGTEILTLAVPEGTTWEYV